MHHICVVNEVERKLLIMSCVNPLLHMTFDPVAGQRSCIIIGQQKAKGRERLGTRL